MKLPPTLPAYEIAARQILPAASSAYLFGGAGSEATLRTNREALDAVRLVPRVFAEMADTAVALFGDTYAAPVLVAPMGYQSLFHPDGECATARAAAALGLGYVVPILSSIAMEKVTAAMEGAPHWFQLYLQQDAGMTLSLLRRAEENGARVIVLTVDAPVDGVRDRQIEAGFALPPHISAVHLEPLRQSPMASGAAALPWGWPSVAWLCRQTALPVIAKGIMHPDDAARAIDCGCRGVIVSNHGGRVLDGAVGARDALPAIAERIGQAATVLFDSGIRRGTDIAKVLGDGAQAVLVGRPVLCGLAVAGDRGAAHVLKMLTEEFDLAMRLTGTPANDADATSPESGSSGAKR